MGSFETNLNLAVTSTTVPFVRISPAELNGVAGYTREYGKKASLGLGTALSGYWAPTQLNRWTRLTLGLHGGTAIGDKHVTLFASSTAGFRFAPPADRYHINIDAGYTLLKIWLHYCPVNLNRY